MITNMVLILQDCLFARYMVDRFGNSILTEEQLALNSCRNFSINLLVGKLFYCWYGFSIQSVPSTALVKQHCNDSPLLLPAPKLP